MNGV
jgi:hypothetical protein